MYDSCRGVNGNADNAATDDFALSGVDANSENDADALQSGPDSYCKLNCAARTVEGHQEPVARGVDLAASVNSQMFAHELVVSQEQCAPGPISDPFGRLGRGDDIGKHVRQQDALRPTDVRCGQFNHDRSQRRVRPVDSVLTELTNGRLAPNSWQFDGQV
jgi:hypothetical protein